MNNQPILFYSTRCAHSAQIINTLKTMNKADLCRMFPIDGKQRHELPPFLKSVPTLYIPDSKDTYIGKDIYAYIAKPVQSRREVPANTPATAAAAQTTGAPAATGDYQGWTFEGVRGITESYSSWDAPGKFTRDDQLQYTFLGGGGMSTPAPAEPQTKQSYDGDKQGRNDDLSSRMEQMKKARETEFKGIARQ
jgi:hypothetical protein